jgi:D-alanyl-D-alanine carboxypeptidase/D-alanyl-D-alanine-endopeptidase (penicillin-binding protein 4)
MPYHSKVFLLKSATILLVVFLSANVLRAQSATHRLADHPALLGASLSASVFDMQTGEVLESHQPHQRLCPASIWKVPVTVAALDVLGPGFKFRTVLATRGRISNGVLHGDLIIVGGGDPSLGSRFLGDGFEAVLDGWVDAVVQAGIDSITGAIVGNSTHFQGDGTPRTRLWEDMANYYGSGVSGLSIHDNTYFVRFTTPDAPDEPAVLKSVYPIVPGLMIESEVKSSTIQSDQAFIFGSPLDLKRVVRGTLPMGRTDFEIKGSIPDPALFAAFHLRDRLFRAGVAVTDQVIAESKRVEEPATLKVINEVLSPPLKVLVKHINDKSDNLFAETLLFQLGARLGKPTLEGGIEAIHKYYKDICESDYPFFVYDGSGLSRFNAVSAAQIQKILLHAKQSDPLEMYVLDALPAAGKTGTMKYFARGTALDGNLKGKSGSMDKVRAYTGFFLARTGREVGFVVMINNFDGNPGSIRELIERWLIEVEGRY